LSPRVTAHGLTENPGTSPLWRARTVCECKNPTPCDSAGNGWPIVHGVTMSERPLPIIADSELEGLPSPVDGAVDDGRTIEASWDTPEMFGEIFDRHFISLSAFCARRVGVVLAQDIVNETFCVAFDQRRRYRTRECPNARPWLMGIAINVMRHEFRRQLREKAAVNRLTVEDNHSDHDAEIVDNLASANRIERVQVVLAKLPDKELNALLLSVLEQQTYEQIAQIMAVPIGTVRSRIHRARKHLVELSVDSASTQRSSPKRSEAY
jgi:RNA polymerase sigma factor (sigma-70 family)